MNSQAARSQPYFPSGFLVVDKPSGWTSFDVVAKLRRTLGVKRIGHLGTLDPLATGVLVVAVGEATKLIEYFMKADKVYEVTAETGRVSDTYDTEGTVIPVASAQSVTEAALQQVLPEFVGVIQQVPPAHSAIQIGGERAYRLARAGKSVELPARTVQIHSIEVLEVSSSGFRLRVHCGSGTYVRSLVHDLGQRLGCGAVMNALRRTLVGGFSLQGAVVPEASLEILRSSLISLERAVQGWPMVALHADQVQALRHGKTLERPFEFPDVPEGGEVAAFHASQLVSLVTLDPLGRVRGVKNFSPPCTMPS